MKKAIVKKINTFGFDVKRIETSNYTSFYGGNCNHVIVLVNKEGKMLSLDGGNTPYTPEGRESAFLFLLENGGWMNEVWL